MLIIIIRTLLIYIVVTFAVRLMGKRQVGDMQTSELVITMIISETACPTGMTPVMVKNADCRM